MLARWCIGLCFLEAFNCVNKWCFIWNVFLCYSLEMENWWLKSRFHWLFYVVETIMALCCLYGFCWRVSIFILFGLASSILTVMIITPSHIWCYGVVVYDFNHLLVTAYHFSTWSWVHFTLLVSTQLVMGGYYAKNLVLGLVGITRALHLYQHYLAIGEKQEGYATMCSWCWLLASKKPLLFCIMVYPTWCELLPCLAS